MGPASRRPIPLLAELYREQQALALLGWSLSSRAAQALVAQQESGRQPPTHSTGRDLVKPADDARQPTGPPGLSGCSRRCPRWPMLKGSFDSHRCGRARAIVLRNLLDEQINYHEGRLQLCERAGHSFVVLGAVLFFAVIAVSW